MKREGNDALVNVHDQGIGMNRALLPKMFGLFVQDERSLDLLKEKFVNCALRVLPEPSVTQLHAAIQELERLDDMRKLTALISPQQKSSGHAAKVARA